MPKTCDTCRFFPECLYSTVMLEPGRNDDDCPSWQGKGWLTSIKLFFFNIALRFGWVK